MEPRKIRLVSVKIQTYLLVQVETAALEHRRVVTDIAAVGIAERSVLHFSQNSFLTLTIHRMAVEVMVQMAMVREILSESILMIPIAGTNAGQGSGFSLSDDVSLDTFNLSPGAGGEFCGPQFGLYGGGGGGGVLVEGKVRQVLKTRHVFEVST